MNFVALVKSRLQQGLQIIVGHELLLAAFVALIVIAGSLALGHENNGLVPPSPVPIAHYQAEPNNPLGFMAHWDSPDYLTIGTAGYTDAAQTNFFPLYPL